MTVSAAPSGRATVAYACCTTVAGQLEELGQELGVEFFHHAALPGSSLHRWMSADMPASLRT